MVSSRAGLQAAELGGGRVEREVHRRWRIGLRAFRRDKVGACLTATLLRHSAMDYRSIITVDPEKRFGKPCIRGMRIAVEDVLGWLASDMTEAEILSDF